MMQNAENEIAEKSINQNKIDTSKLNKGDILSYKQICTALNIPTYTGKQKIAQLEKLKLYFDYNKDKTKYTILEVYKKPLEPKYKYPANTLYTELIEQILLQYLVKQPGYKAYITPSQLWYQLGMVNGYFIKYKNNKKDDLINKYGINSVITIKDVNDFYKRCWSKFSTIIFNSFKSLYSQKLIKYDLIYRIGVYKSNKDFYTFIDYDLHDADELEQKEILKVEKQVLNEFGFKNDRQMKNSDKVLSYYKRTEEIYREEYGWNVVFLSYKILYNKEDVIKAITKEELNDKKMDLNNRIIEALNRNAEYNYDKLGYTSDDIVDLMDKDGNVPEGIFYYPIEYVNNQIWLTDKLINIKGDKE